MKDKFLEEIRQGVLWVVAFIGVSILVGLGKLRPETIEYMLFSLLGYGAARLPKPPQEKDNEDGS
jgi:hypothetical protein